MYMSTTSVDIDRDKIRTCNEGVGQIFFTHSGRVYLCIYIKIQELVSLYICNNHDDDKQIQMLDRMHNI